MSVRSSFQGTYAIPASGHGEIPEKQPASPLLTVGGGSGGGGGAGGDEVRYSHILQISGIT